MGIRVNETPNTAAIAGLLQQTANKGKAGAIAAQTDDKGPAGSNGESRENATSGNENEARRALQQSLGQDTGEGDSQGEDREGEAGADTGDKTHDAVSLDDLAKMLDVPVKEVYGVQIPVGNGATATLGQLKDAYKRVAGFDAEKSKFDDHRRKQENEILVARRETDGLVRHLMGSGRVSQDDIAAVRKITQSQQQREYSAMLAVRPEWSDKAQREADFDAFVELGAEYGFSDVEMRNVPDHRILKMLYDFSAAKRHARQQGNGKTPPSMHGGSRSPAARTPTLAERKRQAAGGGQAARLALSAEILTGKIKLE
jgi:hypothetical protein